MNTRSTAAHPEDLSVSTPEGCIFARRWRVGTEAPSAPTLVMLHDSLGCVETWRDFPLALAHATGLGVVAYDRLGFGRSSPFPIPRDASVIELEARTTLPALRAQLGLDRLLLFGHSVGGAMAVAAAAAHPGCTAAVITEAAQAFVEERTLEGIRGARLAFAAPDRFARLVRAHGEKARTVLDAWTHTWLDAAFARWSLDRELERLRCPLLVLHGDRDEFGSRAHPARMARHHESGTRVVLLDDCGHVPHREQPEAVLRAVREFVQRL